MENREFLEQIQQYAVRIGNAGDKELYGSGTLFLVSKRKKVCVLTAAHVVYSLMGKIKKQELKICLTCKDKKDDIHCIIVDDTKCICIYSEYNKNKRKKEFFNDLALIDIPWESWMDDMTGFRLASGNSGVEIKGYGFPLSLDEEKDRSLADLFAGIECLTGTIESQNVGRLAIKYDVHTGSDIERDSIMEGYSGTGLFSLETDGICYRGLVSCSRGDKTAGYTMWATDAGKITELMKENNIEIECPESFEPYENCWRELKKELEVREEIQNQENKIAEETKKICELGSEFLLNHREQTSCPLCKEPFANWEELFERVNRVGKTTEKENREKRQLIINHINELDIEYEKFYNMFFSKKENEQVKRLDQLIIYEREKNNKEIQLGNLEIEIDSLRKKIQLNEEWLENQDIILNEYSMEEWEMWLENKKVECRKLQLQKDELKKKIEELHTIRQNNKAHVEIKSKQKESIIDNSKLYSMILFLMEKPDEFDVGFERNSLKTSIELLRTEEKKKRNDLMKYKECGQIDEMDIKQKVSECDTEIANLQELKKQACIFENFSPEGMEKSINTWEKEKKNYEAQLELLYEMREENGARTYFEKYTAICKKIENQNKNLENKVLQIRKVKKSYEIEKNTLEMKLKDYFSQTIMNEIYQKIDPHEIMKNVTYHLNFNEKDEPQLFIEVCEGEESSKEVYRPETYFSTAQLNTVAFSSFFGRALSTNNLPVKTICIDDPIGHFDDMNILGFTDMVRCILEKQDCQIIMSTHEEKVYQIMKRKLDPNFYNTLFIQLDNSEKVIWNRANC